MKSIIIFKRDNKNFKKPLHLTNGVFLFYALRNLKIPSMQFERFDTKVTIYFPKILVDILLQNLKRTK